MARADLNLAPLCGRALLEASLSGCPAVSYEFDWHADIVHTGITGELIPNLDFQAMGKAAVKLLKDKKVRAQMRSSMSILAHELASPERITSEQVKIYSDLILEEFPS